MSEYTTAENWELQDVKPNSNRDEIKLQGKLDFRLGKNINFTVGGSFSNMQRMSPSGEDHYLIMITIMNKYLII